MKSTAQIAAENVRAAYKHRGIASERQLAELAKVAPNSIKNLMRPEERAPTKRGDAAPRLDVLEKVAKALGYEPWQMLVPTFDPLHSPVLQPVSPQERLIYESVRATVSHLTK